MTVSVCSVIISVENYGCVIFFSLVTTSDKNGTSLS